MNVPGADNEMLLLMDQATFPKQQSGHQVPVSTNIDKLFC